MDKSPQDTMGLPPPLPVPAMYSSNSLRIEGLGQFDAATRAWIESNSMHKNWLTQAVGMADINREIPERQKAADDVLDGFDLVSSSFNSPDVTQKVIFLMVRTLTTIQPSFVQDDPVNIFRKTILRLVHRLVLLEISRTLHDGVVPALIALMETENEENGILCMKTLMEVIKMGRLNQPNNIPSAIFNNPALVAFVVKLCRRWIALPQMLPKVLDMGQVRPTYDARNAVDFTASSDRIVSSVVINNSSSPSGEPSGNPIVFLPKTSSSLRFLAESVMIIMFTQAQMRTRIEELYPNLGQDALYIMMADLETDRVEQAIADLQDKPSEQARVLGAYHEYMITYCKVPQLFAYATRHFCKNDDTTIFAQCVVKLLKICPKEIVWGRREIFGAIKHIANSDQWRGGLTPYIPQLLDLDFLLGPSVGCKDILKATAVSMAMDVLHYVRGELGLAVFDQVFSLCISYFADRTLGISLHMILLRTMSNLSDNVIARARQEGKLEEGRVIFLRVLNILGLRLKVMVKYSLPVYKTKLKSAAAQGTAMEPGELTDNSSHVLTEQRTFLRSIASAIRTFLYCVKECSVDGNLFIRPEDLKILTRVCKYCVQATELFVVGIPGAPGMKPAPAQAGKTLEKDFTENLADTMKMFPFDVYRDIFQHMFWHFLDLFKDEQLQQILTAVLNCLIPYAGFSGITTTTMLDVGVSRFPELAEAGNDVSLSVLKIFKILFGAVSLYPKEVEQYFKPLLQKIFHQGFSHCMRAKDPYNLLLMFRAFFRAMGGGGHEVLYQDFLPNLPMILQVLCNFHSQRQKPAFNDIFIELCLIVPVRLSTLMPHISLLAPAILTAMQGTPNSSAQGLRTLELCIDNMSNDYLYEQLEPVKKELMKALWGIMMTGSAQMQITALRFLGKMCGHALKAIREPQQLHPKTIDDDLGPCIVLNMPTVTDPLHVPIFRIIEEAYKTLLDSTLDLNTRNAAWNIVQSYLLGILRPDPTMQALENLLLHPGFKQTGKTGCYSVVTCLSSDTPYAKCTDEKNRLATQTCLQGLMVAAATKDFRNTAMPLFAKFVRHFSLMAICQQSGVFSKPETVGARGFHMEAIDPYVILDAIIFILGHEEQAISRTGDAGIILILETLKAVYEDLKHCVMLPFLNYLFEKLHSLCYEKAWCCKAGALSGISPLIDYMPLSWTVENSVLLTRALIFVLRDSFQNMTYGIIEVTKKLLDKVLRRVLSPPDLDALPQDLQNLRLQAIQEIIREFVLSSTCLVEDVRTQAMDSLKLLAEILEQPLGKMLEPHQKLIAEFVPPKRPSTMKSYQMTHQMALLEANRFFLSISPTVASYDPNKPEDIDVIVEILDFLKLEDEPLQQKYQCFDFRQYYPLSFLPYRVAAFRFVTMFASFPTVNSLIHQVLLDTLTGGSDDLLDVATECLTKFAAEAVVGRNVVTDFLTATKAKLEVTSSFSKSLTDRLVRLQTVYPDLFDEDFAKLTFTALPLNLELAAVEQKEIPHICDGVKKCALMITLLSRTTRNPEMFIQPAVELIVQTEEVLMTRNGRQLTAALSSFLRGHGAVVIDIFFHENRILQPKWIAFFEKLLRGKDELPVELKTHLTTDKLHLLTNMITFVEDSDHHWQSLSVGIRVLYLLAKKDTKWLISNPDVIETLRRVWANPAFNRRLRGIIAQSHDTWELSVKFLVLLMVHVRTHCDDTDALFEMTRHSSRSIAESSRWRQFVECHMVMSLTPQNRRQMALKWLDMVKNKAGSDEYLADICDLVIQPILKQQFMQGSADLMVNESPSTPDSSSTNHQGNLIHIAAQILLVEDSQLVFRMTENLRVSCLKLLVLFTEHAENYFPEPKTGQNNLTSKFSLLACQLLLKKDREHIQIDVATVYQAQTLLAQISGRGQVATRYIPAILRSLFQGGQIEPRNANRAAIDILVPNLLTKNPDNAVLLCSFLRKLVTEDINNFIQISIIFQAIVRHRQHFYSYRQPFIALMWNCAQKLGLSSATSLELKRTAVDILECIVSWEATRKSIEVDYGETSDGGSAAGTGPSGTSKVTLKASQSKRPNPLIPPSKEGDKALDQKVVDGVASVLLRLSFMFGEPAQTDFLGRRCFRILKFFMRRDMFPNADLRMQWMDRILGSVDQNPGQPKSGQSDQNQQGSNNTIPSVCLALETLTYFIPTVNRSVALNVIHDLSPSLIKVTMCFNARVAKCMNQLIAILCAIWPGDPVSRNLPNQLETLYSQLIKVIHEGLSDFERISPGPQTHIFCTLMLLKATIPHVPSILDRFLTLVANAAKKIMDEHLGIGKTGGASQPVQSQQDGVVSAELVVVVLDVIKVPAFFTSNSGQPSHRQTIIGIMSDLIGRSSDVRVHRALIRIFNEWLSNPERDREPSTSGVGGGGSAINKTLSPQKPVRKPKKKRDEEEFSVDEPSSLDDKKKKKKEPKQAGFLDTNNLPPMPPQLPLVDDIQTVTPKELSNLILKLQIQIERKFVEDSELQSLYTTLVYKIFSQQDEKMLELQQRLTNAYMYGLRHPDPEWRRKFYVIHDRHYALNMQERLNSLLTGISWDTCTLTYYIGFCINSLLGLATNQGAVMSSSLHNVKLILPVSAPATEPLVSQHADSLERRFSGMSESVSDTFDNGSPEISSDEPPRLKEFSVATIVERVYKLNDLTKATTVRSFLDGVFQLCHTKNQLANDIWILVLPQIWKLLNGEQRDVLITNFRTYLMTQSHQAQRDLVHFPIQAMWDAMVKCEGVSLKLHPMAVLYLGERQNLWYRSVLHLEDMAMPAPTAVPSQKGGNKNTGTPQGSQQPSESDPTAGMNQMIHGVLWSNEESLQRMYTALGEDDFATAVWHLRAAMGAKSDQVISRPMLEFRTALGYERQGLYYDAKEAYEKAMDTFLVDHRDKTSHESEFGELQVLSERYTEVLKQLNQWPALYNVAINESVANPCLALEAAWHQNSFDVIPALLQNADKQCPPREELNFGFCKAYNSLHKVLKEGLSSPPTAYKDEGVDRLIDCLQQVCIKMWRHLPRTGTMAHRPLIEMATRVSDLKELLTILPALHSAQACQAQHVVLLKNMVKNWKLRVPGTADDLRFWGEIAELRQQVLTHVINLSTEIQHYPACGQDILATLSTFPILSIHTISQNYFQFSKAARMQQVPKFALEILSRVQTLPVVPLIDCFERVKNHVLACLALFEQSNQPSDLQSALAAIEGVTMQYFTKEMYAELTALRSQVCIKMMKVDEGHKLIAAAVQMYDNCNEGWLRFGDYYEMLFQKTPQDLQLAKQAVVAYIFGSRSSCDSVARECCAKMIALLNCDDSTGTISSAFEEAVTIIPPIVLVFWVPQLIHLMMREETAQAACTLLTHVAKLHPQPVYLHVRTYFNQMKAIDRSKDSKSPMGASISSPTPETKPAQKRRRTARDAAPVAVHDPKGDGDVSGDGTTIRASAFVKNCASIIKAVSESQPTICNALESFANQIISINMSPERWYEELLAQLIQALKRCYALAYEKRERVMQATLTPSMIQYVNTMVRSFGTGVYQEPGGVATGSGKGFQGDVASEAITKRAQSLQGSSEYNKLKKDFLKDFDCSDQDNVMLQSMISKLKKWIRIFEKIIKTHAAHCYLDANHRPLTSFTNLTADMELPGDHSMQRNLNVIKVVQILPRMDVVMKHNLVCRRLYFVNNVGDIIPYLIIGDNANNVQGRKEERILQLFMAMNPILDEFPEASRRALKYYVPKITPVAPAVRLMEDSQASVCVWEIYKKYCDKKNIDADGPVIKFYEKLVAHLHRNQGSSQGVLRDCLKEIQMGLVQSRVLRDYFLKLYTSADEYFLFRKTFIRSHAIVCIAEYVLRLTKLTPDMMHIHTESGVLGVYSFTFDLDERNGELVPPRPVPFRLTPNLTEIFTCYGVSGPLQQSMVATARALKQFEQKFKANIKTIFWDELTYWMVFRKEMGQSLAFSEAVQANDRSDALASLPTGAAVAATPAEPNLPALMLLAVKRMLAGLHEISHFTGHDSAALRHIGVAKHADNLCRMDPSWHPWL